MINETQGQENRRWDNIEQPASRAKVMREYVGRILSIILIAPLVLGSVGKSDAQAANRTAMTATDCVKCHVGPAEDMATDGAAHQTISCFACHPGHRPAEKNNIPTCVQCHSGTAHYKQKECSGCHENAHAPLNISFGYNITAPCLTCHAPQMQQLKENRSKHSKLFCSSCHDVHRVAPTCMRCHKPHAPEMIQADCSKCHKAHMPKVVAFPNDISDKDCMSCHQKATVLLDGTTTRHKGLSCLSCHAGNHKTTPSCESCHGIPHTAAISERFPRCSQCHYLAHDLNNWPVGEPPEARLR